jgi:hypothetical protein
MESAAADFEREANEALASASMAAEEQASSHYEQASTQEEPKQNGLTEGEGGN